MHISILVKSALIIYVDERLTSLLGQSAKNWIGKRPIDYLYKHDTALLLTKLCDLTSKIKIEPFFLRFKKEKDLMTENNNNKKFASSVESMPRLIMHCDSSEYIAFRVELKANKVELKTLNDGYASHHKNNMSDKSTSNSSHSENINLEACIMFNLSFPTIAYYLKSEMFNERSFISQHDVNLKITRVENTATGLLGYLPQDIEGRSLVKFIHSDDLEKIKLIHYESKRYWLKFLQAFFLNLKKKKH